MEVEDEVQVVIVISLQRGPFGLKGWVWNLIVAAIETKRFLWGLWLVKQQMWGCAFFSRFN